jgi:2-polyprenyl-6-methoxyphenol hydroxylase-like FAD-dependent oxidoreductase
LTEGGSLRTDVVIAGGGPVGLVLALELGLRGVRCVLLNDQPTTAQHPKANAVSSRTMEHLRRLGVARRLRARGLDDDHPTDVSYFTRLTGHEIGRLGQPSRVEAMRRARAGEGDWPSPEPPHRVSQIFLEQELKRRADEVAAIDARFGWRLEAFDDLGDHVTATASGPDGAAELAIEAEYLVGCDGANSLVRETLGIEYEGESGVVRPMMGGPMYATYFEVDPDPPWLPEHRAWQYWTLNPDVRALLIHVDSRDKFLLHCALTDSAAGEPVDPVPLIHRAVGAEFPVRIISSVNWTAGYSLVTQRYGEGRVFLAGDSAHLFTPTGGMGMNTGVDDAVNLGWKLAAAVTGWGGSALLDSYEAERRPIGIRNLDFARQFADSVGTVPISDTVEADTGAARAERAALKDRLERHGYFEFIIPGIFLGLNYAASPVIAYDGTTPPTEHPNRYAPNACPGSRAPHAWLGEDALFDRLGGEFTLIRFGAAPDAGALRAAAGQCDLPITVLDVTDDALRDTYGRDLVLVRPDQHVAWRGNRLPDDCAALIDTIRGA